MSKIGKVRDELTSLLAEHRQQGMLPTNTRFLFYELVSRRIIAKDEGSRPDNILHVALTELREKGLVPWNWIEDETRELLDHTGYETMRDAVRATLRHSRLDAWDGNPPLIITESRSLGGALRSLVTRYAVRFSSVNGQCAGHLHNNLSPALNEGDVVLYLGDEDFSGGHIEANTKKVLESEVGELNWERLAVTEEQIAEYDLTIIQKYDARTKSHHDAVETEALGQARIIDIVRSRLVELLPEPREMEEREEIERLLTQ